MTNRTRALVALGGAGILWGTTVPLTKLSLDVVGPAWLAAIRFAVAGAVMLVVLRPRLRGAIAPAPLFWGAVGYGGCVLVQNIGVHHTSVTHAALLIGTLPVVVAVSVVLFRRTRVSGLTWIGLAVSLAGIVVVSGTGGSGASLRGDLLVLVSVLIGAAFTVRQASVLRGRDPVAVTAVQFLAAAAVTLPLATLTEGGPLPASVPGAGHLMALAALATVGTVVPFTLFAFAQSHVEPHVAGAFLNLETVVGTVIGAGLLGEGFGTLQAAGAMAILLGIAVGWAAENRPGSAPVEVEPRGVGGEAEPGQPPARREHPQPAAVLP